jgi:cell division protease FtsH
MSSLSRLRRRFRRVETSLTGRGPRWALGMVLLIAITGYGVTTARHQVVRPARSYSAFLSGLANHRVDSLQIMQGVGFTVYTKGRPDSVYTVVYANPLVDAIAAKADSAGAQVSFSPRAGNTPLEWISTSFNILLLLGLGVLVVRMSNGSVGGTKDVGSESTSRFTFANVAGNTQAVAELREMVDFVRHPERFAALGARPPRGALLIGPPGTGKTLMAKALAGEAKVPCYTISGSEVTGFIVGLGVMRLKKLFKKARNAPNGAIIFIDEVDALGGTRGRNSSHNEDDRTLNQLLVEMDGFGPTTNVFVLASTNRAETLDPALTRPGRFDRQIAVGLPSADERSEIVKLHVAERRIPMAADVDLDRLARLMPGASGAVLANLVNEAAIVGARDASTAVTWFHIEQARDRLLLGAERPLLAHEARETDVVSVHEAGHALAGVLACPEDALHKLTIQPRGQALGVAFFSPDGDRVLYTRQYLEGQLIKTLAGRVAEAIVFGRDVVTSGASSDLVHANKIARDMVARLGLGPATGLLVNGSEPGTQVSPSTLAVMDEEIKTLLDDAYAKATSLLTEYREALDALTAALKAQKTMDGHAVLALLREHDVSC